ncbi:MAG: RNA polymerase sigma factor [Ktedonobacterales bacterium]
MRIRSSLASSSASSPSPPEMLTVAAFTAIVDHHQHTLHAFLRGVIASPELARDLTQDAFADAWRCAQAGTSPFTAGHTDDEVRRCLFHAAYYKAISVLRRRRLITWESLDTTSGPEPVLVCGAIPFEDQIAEGEALRAALARLNPQDTACLLLRVVQGFSAAETGQIVGAAPDVVAKRLSRAKQRLRAAYLAQEAGEPRPQERTR